MAIVGKTSAYLVTDSRYWLQAEEELDRDWTLIRAPVGGGMMEEGYKDWTEFLIVSVLSFGSVKWTWIGGAVNCGLLKGQMDVNGLVW